MFILLCPEGWEELASEEVGISSRKGLEERELCPL